MKRSSKRLQRTESEDRKLLDDLVSMSDDGVSRFRKRWAKKLSLTVLRWEDRHQRNDKKDDEELLQFRDELRLLWGGPIEDIGDDESGVIELGHLQITKRTSKLLAIAENVGVSLQELVLSQWLSRAGTSQIIVKWTSRFKGIRPNPHSLGVRLAFACVENADYLRYCRNPQCLMPYFIAERYDQRYCSNRCGNHGKKEAKSRWWNQNRAKRQDQLK